MFQVPQADALIAAALAEDLGVLPARLFAPDRRSDDPRSGEDDSPLLAGDVTSMAVVPAGEPFSGVVRAREPGVVCGLPLLERVFAMLSSAVAATSPGDAGRDVETFPLVAEGAEVAPGDAVAEVEGDARTVLAGERTALNLLQTLSGIATESRRWAEAAKATGTPIVVLDTRKTLPGMRILSKYAVAVGGASNHRTGLFDMVLVKDNHLRRAGGVAEAVRRARAAAPHLQVEIEADSLAQAVEAAASGADIVLLDNMDDEMLARTVLAVRDAARSAGRDVLTEASGGIRLERLASLARTGVDRVSSSALTLAPPLDFGLDEVVLPAR